MTGTILRYIYQQHGSQVDELKMIINVQSLTEPCLSFVLLGVPDLQNLIMRSEELRSKVGFSFHLLLSLG